MITLNDVTMQYDTTHPALRGVNVHIDKGEFVFVVGASGAGKSTFVKMLTHELVPQQGSILINGQDITRLSKSQVPYYRRKLGIVFQDFRLLEEKTVYENIAFVLRVTGTKERIIRERTSHVLNLVGLRGKENERPSKLSGGEQQRVAIARALANQPLLLIADEPTGNLDPNTSSEIMNLFNSINHMGTTIIMVTHNQELVNAMNKRVLLIDEGHIVKDVKKGGYIAHV
ncbi:cell division ATP-binding protein FtsE [Dialister pneumosintes]|jgi:cell division ATP-binding protein FtsE|uniref:Cell division ATP-binding protein FtsE n=1 Tax=Dialister pneumosintes TaxID=39950 RepID=A0A1B3WD45_9FIRM|nr:cell division ATP-binding protein FtsE [Dialister pneumosintes]AOH38894.1 cell division ATP-binding protein FtsE [Dialister pneumosintes]MBS6479961.1 cell division ATP-binding protein FtsE [Dialister sp.]RID94144.1 cell division ATP-binding protein FtsE [Dialister pneumosintes]CDF27829.1 cell division ATP-binding protein FtsE [Dialister sp. CAG:588]